MGAGKDRRAAVFDLRREDRQMNAPAKTRSPAPCANTGNRAEVTRNDAIDNIVRIEPEGNFAAKYVARRFGLAMSMARGVAMLANIGRDFT